MKKFHKDEKLTIFFISLNQCRLKGLTIFYIAKTLRKLGKIKKNNKKRFCFSRMEKIEIITKIESLNLQDYLSINEIEIRIYLIEI